MVRPMNITFVTNGKVPSVLLKILSIDDYKVATCRPSDILNVYPMNASSMVIIIGDDLSEMVFVITELRRVKSKALIFANVTEKNLNGYNASNARAQLLHSGADDAQCLITVEEMYARIQALFKREQSEGEAIEHGAIHIQAGHNGRVYINRVPVQLTSKEFLLFHKLTVSPNRIFSQETLMEDLYSHHEDRPNSKIIDVFVCKIRKKIRLAAGGANLVKTIWSLGYQIAPIEEHEA